MLIEPQGISPASTSGRRLALVVGVNGESAIGRAPLHYAVDDGRDIAQVLQQDYCGFELFRPPLLGEQATTSQVRDAVLDLSNQLREDDFALFFFSGHAEAIPLEADLDDVYLVTSDFNVSRIRRDRNACLSLRWLRQMLFEHDQAKHILLILDCCYAGKFADSAPNPYLDTLFQRLRYYFGEPSAQSASLPGGIRLALTATGINTAQEQDGHGLLTGPVLAALRGECEQAVNERGEVTFTRLFGFLKTAMPVHQQPRFLGAGDELVLAIHPDRSQHQHREHEQEAQRTARRQRLSSMLSNHHGFLQDRLESFVGREQEMIDVGQYIDQLLSTGGYLTITGHAGQGKSSIIAKLIASAAKKQEELDCIAFHFIPLTPPPDYQVALLRNLMARLVLKYELSDLYLVSESRAALSEGFPRVLQEIAEKGGQEIIFVDGLDQLQPDPQTGLRDLSFLPQGPVNPPQGIVFVLGTRPNDTLRPLELLKPYHEYQLPNMSRADFDDILHHRGVVLERSLANRFYEMLGENAFYLDLVAKELAARHDMTNHEVEEVIQQIANDPENLFSLTIDRLRRPETLWSTVIKPILGLLLVTNEPLVREHIKSLLHFTFVTNLDGEQLNQGLERLGGLVVIDEQQRYSLFHLKFRDYLGQNTQNPKGRYVFDSEDEQRWHRTFVAWCEQDTLAEIWESIFTDSSEQGRRYYVRQHYITHLYLAKEWDKLFRALDEGAYGKAKVKNDPSTRSYTLDLDLGRKAAASSGWNRERAIEHLPYLWRYTLLRCSLASRADMYFREAFELMLLLGYETKALGLAELLTGAEYKAQIFMLIASHLIRIEREREGLQLFWRAEQIISSIPSERRRITTLLILSAALARIHRWQEAERVIGSISDEEGKATALVTLGTALAQAQQWQEAERVIGSISDEKSKAAALVTLGTALAQTQQWQEAERVIGSISDEESKAAALVTLGTALAQAQQWQEAKQQWQEAKQIIGSISDEESKAISLATLGTALAQAQQWQKAKQQWQEAKQIIGSISDEESKAAALVTLGTALAQAQQWQEAEQQWQEAKQIIGSISDEESKAISLATLGTALAQAQQWQKAEQIIKSISIMKRRTTALVMLTKALAQAQQWQAAEKIIGTISDKWNKTEALIILSTALIQAQQWQAAEQIIKSISPENRRAVVLVMLSSALTQAQQWQAAEQIWQKAEQIISSVSNKQSKVATLIVLSSALTQAQQWREAIQVIHSISEGKNQAKALVELVLALTQAQQWQKAEEVIGSISDEQSRTEAKSTLGIALAQAQQWQMAEEVIGSISDEQSRTEAQISLSVALALAQQWQASAQIISSILNKGNGDVALIKLSTALAQAQQWQKAEEVIDFLAWDEIRRVIDSISEKEEWNSAVLKLSTALAQAQQWQMAEEVIGSISNEQSRTEAQISLSVALALAQQWQASAQIISSILNKGNGDVALFKLSTALAQAQQWQMAEKVIGSISNEQSRTAALVNLSTALAQEQQWQMAAQIVNSISNKGSRDVALVNLSSALAQAQQWQMAEKVINSIFSTWSKTDALINLSIALAQYNNYSRLIPLIQQEWLRATSREEALRLLPLAYSLFPLVPNLAIDLVDAFSWADSFLQK